MKHFITRVGLIIVALTLLVFGVTLAHEGDDTTSGSYMSMPWMTGYGMGYDGHMWNCRQDENITQSLEDTARLKEIRKEFFEKTQELRDKIEQNQLALSQELRKTEPDPGRAFNLQKELSELKSDFDQKALEHQLALKKTFPDSDLSLGYGNGEKYCW